MNPTDVEPILKQAIRDVPNFPKKGIIFKDITPLLGDGALFALAVDRMTAPYENQGIQKVIGIESRGFLLATAVAYKLGAGVVPVRKKGKLPHQTASVSYDLEYGTDTLEMHRDAFSPGTKILVVDDVLATGGTAKATCDLADQLEASIAGVVFLIELAFLKGREKLKKQRVHSLIQF